MKTVEPSLMVVDAGLASRKYENRIFPRVIACSTVWPDFQEYRYNNTIFENLKLEFFDPILTLHIQPYSLLDFTYKKINI